jgi:hypothetical protein
LRDAETGAQTVIDAGDARWRKAFAAQAAARDLARRQAITRAGAELLVLPEGESPLAALARFMRGRKR